MHDEHWSAGAPFGVFDYTPSRRHDVAVHCGQACAGGVQITAVTQRQAECGIATPAASADRLVGRSTHRQAAHAFSLCGVARTDEADPRRARNSAVASTAIHAMNVAMLMRSQTPTPGVGKSA